MRDSERKARSERVLELYRKGLSQTLIAKRLNMKKQSVNKIITQDANP